MNASLAASRDPIAGYLNRVASGLKGMSESQRQEIVAEIRSHLAERMQQFGAGGSPRPAEEAVAAMGDANALARQFALAATQQTASRSFAPWVLLRAAARVALSGMKGLVVFLLGLFGYATALAFFVAALLKPLKPSAIGFWVGPHLFVWGMPDRTIGGHELAGQYFIPVSIALAFLFASGTTLALRWLTRPALSVEYLLNRFR